MLMTYVRFITRSSVLIFSANIFHRSSMSSPPLGSTSPRPCRYKFLKGLAGSRRHGRSGRISQYFSIIKGFSPGTMRLLKIQIDIRIIMYTESEPTLSWHQVKWLCWQDTSDQLLSCTWIMVNFYFTPTSAAHHFAILSSFACLTDSGALSYEITTRNERNIDFGRPPFGEPGGHVSFLHALNLLMSTFTYNCSCMCTELSVYL